MKAYLKHMRVPLIILGVLLVITIFVRVKNAKNEVNYERSNDVCTTTQRVYDYADVLTDHEEQKLEELIAKREKQIGCDIVLVIINEPLKAYADSYADRIGYMTEDKYVMVYADNFYDENEFGYNKPHGDGCVFVDNWDRTDSAYGYAYAWFSTSGKVEDSYSTTAISNLVDSVTSQVNDDPYEAYKEYVESVYRHMSGKSALGIPALWALVAAIIVMTGYLGIHMAKNSGQKTTTSTTYVNGGRPVMNRQQDILINTNVTRRHIERSSGGGGGGGGHHTSAGGYSHGGGGGHH